MYLKRSLRLIFILIFIICAAQKQKIKTSTIVNLNQWNLMVTTN